MREQELLKRADEFIEANLEDIIRDIKAIVDIPSVISQPEEGAPYGKEIKRALLEALKIYAMSVAALNDCPLKLPE